MKVVDIDVVNFVLNRLHNDAKKDIMRVGKGMIKSIFRPMSPNDFKNAYLPISQEQGQFLKKMIIDNECKHVIEFGTSFGISTIYLADAVRKTGGKVITTELLENKARIAKQNINDAKLEDYVDIKVGDALETLKDNSSPIDLLFLDGWKDLYLPLFKLLEPQFHSGTLIYADNMDMQATKPYSNYLRSCENTYSTETVSNGKAFLTKTL